MHHAGGATTLRVNQELNGGQWVYLGAFELAPGQNHRVVLSDDADDIVVADALKFVREAGRAVVADALKLVAAAPAGADFGATASTLLREYVTLNGQPLALIDGGEILTVHPDHLGTPQKMTDSGGQIFWDALYRPFGEAHAIAGTADNAQRFPGQLHDAETSLHYNYFRDYDPSLGRYVQSDPIGLEGGLNTYAYALENPVLYTDSLGLDVYICERPADLPFPLNMFNHYWIKTDSSEAGMGGMEGGVPAQEGRSDKPYDQTQITDHSGQSSAPNSSCEKQENVDEQCVEELIRVGTPTGSWHPLNQCRNFVYITVTRCRFGPQIP